MRRIFLIFALICFLLAGYLFMQTQQLAADLKVITADRSGVEQNLQTVRKQLRRARVLVWAAVGGGVLLGLAAAGTGRKRAAPAP